VVAALNELADRGLVRRSPDPGDRRRKHHHNLPDRHRALPAARRNSGRRSRRATRPAPTS
jgi:DNA-binding MarR family transcriptional regulator